MTMWMFLRGSFVLHVLDIGALEQALRAWRLTQHVCMDDEGEGHLFFVSWTLCLAPLNKGGVFNPTT